jgi:hypothetical protein
MIDAAQLAESEGFADEGGMHELLHDHTVSSLPLALVFVLSV